MFCYLKGLSHTYHIQETENKAQCLFLYCVSYCAYILQHLWSVRSHTVGTTFSSVTIG